ncbi:hypothetical protein L284_17785 [Novosphingobium lindaniclasticum LE124]|uniref:Uncharacterized protein n=1 Tax=Novosphingobium lindaniclasticum LE124 TaxID=1096930 RepID=T0H1P6_9SPHN|nr:hypothetical protein L284_17785 [Novosphingobium lindaniclasticum LE124]
MALDQSQKRVIGYVTVLPANKLVMKVNDVPRQRDLEAIQKPLRCTKCKKRGASVSTWPQP